MRIPPRLGRLLRGAGLSLLAAIASAAPVARIDFLLRDDVRLTVVEIGVGGEAKESTWNDTRSLVCTFPASSDWRTASVTLRPSRDGRVVLLPMGERQASASPMFIRYDKIEADDGSVKNGEFKHLDDKRIPLWWTLSSFTKSQEATATVLDTGARDGSRAIRVWHDSRFVQTLSLKADIPVTFTFRYRAD